MRRPPTDWVVAWLLYLIIACVLLAVGGYPITKYVTGITAGWWTAYYVMVHTSNRRGKG